VTRVSREVIRNWVWLTFLLLLTFIGLLHKIFPNYPVGVLVDVVALFILFEFFGLITIKNLKLINTSINGPLLLFIAFGVFQIFNPFLLNLLIGFEGFLSLFFPMLFFFVGANLVTKKSQVHKIFRYLLWLGLLASLLGVVQIILVPMGIAKIVPIGNNYGYYYLGSLLKEKVVLAYGGPLFRITSTFGNFSSFSFFLNIYILASLGFYFSTHKKRFLFMSLIGVIALLLTFLRIAYISIFLGICLIVYFISKQKRFQKVFGVLIAIFLLLILLAILPNNVISERILSIFGQSPGSAALAFMVRLNMYKMYIEKFGSHLLIGNGLGTTVGISEKYAEQLTFGVVIADNDMMNILYQTGGFGLLLFAVIILQILYHGYKIAKRGDQDWLPNFPAIIYCILVSIIILSLAYDPLVEVPSNYLFWFFAGILLSYKRKKEIGGEKRL
jgi:hypothetical protein